MSPGIFMEVSTIQNLKRAINMGFRVTPEEQAQIIARMKEANIGSVRAYLLKMALNGMILKLDLSQINECSGLLRNISNNVNQLAKRVNGGGHAAISELVDVQTKLDEVWQQQEKLIRSLTKILEAV